MQRSAKGAKDSSGPGRATGPDRQLVLHAAVPSGCPPEGFKYASTKLVGGGTEAIDQDTLLEVIQQPGAGEKEVTELFSFWRPSVCGSRKSTLLTLTNKQLDIMYAVAGCVDVVFLISRVKSQVRKAVEQVYGIDKNNFAIWYKNRGRNPSKSCYPDFAAVTAIKRLREPDAESPEFMPPQPAPAMRLERGPPASLKPTLRAMPMPGGKADVALQFDFKPAVGPDEGREDERPVQSFTPRSADGTLTSLQASPTGTTLRVRTSMLHQPPNAGLEHAGAMHVALSGSQAPVRQLAAKPLSTLNLMHPKPLLLSRLASQHHQRQEQERQEKQQQEGQRQEQQLRELQHQERQRQQALEVQPGPSSIMLQGRPMQQLPGGQVIIQAAMPMAMAGPQGQATVPQAQGQWSQPAAVAAPISSLPPGYHVIAVPSGFQGQPQVLALQPGQQVATMSAMTHGATQAVQPLQLQGQTPQMLQVQPQVQVIQASAAPSSQPSTNTSWQVVYDMQGDQAKPHVFLQQAYSQPLSSLSDKSHAAAVQLGSWAAPATHNASTERRTTTSDHDSCGAEAGPSHAGTEHAVDQVTPFMTAAIAAETSQGATRLRDDAAGDEQVALSASKSTAAHRANQAGPVPGLTGLFSQSADGRWQMVSAMPARPSAAVGPSATMTLVQMSPQQYSAQVNRAGCTVVAAPHMMSAPQSAVPITIVPGAEGGAASNRQAVTAHGSAVGPVMAQVIQQAPGQQHGLMAPTTTLLAGGHQLVLALQPMYLQAALPQQQQQQQGFARAEGHLGVSGASCQMGQVVAAGGPGQTILTSETGQKFVLVQSGSQGQQLQQQVMPQQVMQFVQQGQGQGQQQQMCIQLPASMLGQSFVLAPAQGNWGPHGVLSINS